MSVTRRDAAGEGRWILQRLDWYEAGEASLPTLDELRRAVRRMVRYIESSETERAAAQLGERASDPERQAKRLGGEESLKPKDIADLSAGAKRVLDFMADGEWYTPDQIRSAAGKNGVPAEAGMRRMRELRDVGIEVETRRRDGSRFHVYRIVLPQRANQGTIFDA